MSAPNVMLELDSLYPVVSESSYHHYQPAELLRLLDWQGQRL